MKCEMQILRFYLVGQNLSSGDFLSCILVCIIIHVIVFSCLPCSTVLCWVADFLELHVATRAITSIILGYYSIPIATQ